MLQPFLDRRLNIILAPLDAPGLKHPEAVADLRSSIVDAMKKMQEAVSPAQEPPMTQEEIEAEREALEFKAKYGRIL